jgi:hypothetical protein
MPDIMDEVSFLLQGEGESYSNAWKRFRSAVLALAQVGTPPGKLSLGERVTSLEQAMDAYLGTTAALSSPMPPPVFVRLPAAMPE